MAQSVEEGAYDSFKTGFALGATGRHKGFEVSYRGLMYVCELDESKRLMFLGRREVRRHVQIGARRSGLVVVL